jgi:hypothetical protein
VVVVAARTLPILLLPPWPEEVVPPTPPSSFVEVAGQPSAAAMLAGCLDAVAAVGIVAAVFVTVPCLSQTWYGV